MTFSIVGFDPDENTCGVAVASKFLAVGAVVPFARANVGAIATQSYANTAYGESGLALLASGMPAERVLNLLTEPDEQRALRQVGIVDRAGGAATFTGTGCYGWAGGITGTHFAAQGNVLANADVIAAMAQAFSGTTGDLPQRLLSALLAGDAAGGDKRGRQGAALYVAKAHGSYGGFTDRYIDLRIDDHPKAPTELERLLALHRLFFGATPAAEKIVLTAVLICELQTAAKNAAGYAGPLDGVLSAQAKSALTEFIGNENLEERIDLERGTIDPPALAYVRKTFTG